jgi:hypothetical protein
MEIRPAFCDRKATCNTKEKHLLSIRSDNKIAEQKLDMHMQGTYGRKKGRATDLEIIHAVKYARSPLGTAFNSPEFARHAKTRLTGRIRRRGGCKRHDTAGQQRLVTFPRQRTTFAFNSGLWSLDSVDSRITTTAVYEDFIYDD